MKNLVIIPKKNAVKLIAKPYLHDYTLYYLSDDYEYLNCLNSTFAGRGKINSLSSMFQDVLEEIKESYLSMIAIINKENNSLEWWEGHVASKNSASTPLFLHIIYLFCIKKILADAVKNVVLIIDNRALISCTLSIAGEFGYQVTNYSSKINDSLGNVKLRLKAIAQMVLCVIGLLNRRRVALKSFEPPLFSKNSKRVVIRSWITENTLKRSGDFNDRNFGCLPEWLKKHGYEVLILPMFFNLSSTGKEIFALMNEQKQQFLIPEHYLSISDYVQSIRRSYRLLKKRFEKVVIKNVDVGPLINDVLKKQGINRSTLSLNLSFPLLKRLKDRGVEIEGFYYPFENNAPEKPFILACRKYYLRSVIKAFQHTAFYPNNMAYHLAPEEKDLHPLPDKIICSGSIYLSLLEKSGFPKRLLIPGPNLRYESTNTNIKPNVKLLSSNERNLLVPFTFNDDLAFEALVKLREALQQRKGYKIFIRTHPLLSKNRIFEFQKDIGMDDYVLADEGSIHDWLPRMYAVITTGASITTVEVAAMGIPVIRVIPDNTFHYDSLACPDYPLKAANSAFEIEEQLALIEELIIKDENIFQRCGEKISDMFFTGITQENLKIFL
jgi:surface carbohydrate biosynthesis protein (TIGR04326 family)